MRVGNSFKRSLLRGESLCGLFCCSYSQQVVEALAGSGFDFLLFDNEHTPNALPQLHTQLCALASGDTAPIVRLASLDPVAIKLLLDLGVAGLMVPNVQTVQEAELAVRMTRYPPHGLRGVAGTVRATSYGRDSDYLSRAHESISLIVQLESSLAMAHAEHIAAIPGVDAVFIGPNDLAADMGLLGQPTHPEVRAAVADGLKRIQRTGKAAGVLCSEADASFYREAGASMLALGSDLGLLVKAADGLALRNGRKHTQETRD